MEPLVSVLRLCCHELDLAPARELSLFDGDRAADGELALGRVRLLMSERYGNSSLRRLTDILLSLGQVRLLLSGPGIQSQSSGCPGPGGNSQACPGGLPTVSPNADIPTVNRQALHRCGLFPTPRTIDTAQCPGVSRRVP